MEKTQTSFQPLKLGCDKYGILYIHTTSTTETHIHIHAEYEREGGRQEIKSPLSLHFVDLQSLPTKQLSVREKEERWGTKEGGQNTNQRQNPDLSHSPYLLSCVDFHCRTITSN